MLPTIERPPRRSMYSSAMRYPASGALAPRLRALAFAAEDLAAGAADLRAVEEGGAGVPLASRSATRVSARSTLTSTCFFNVNQSFGIGWGRARCGRAPAMQAPSRWAQGPWAGMNADGRAQLRDVVVARLGGLTVWREVRGVHRCLLAQDAALQRLRGARLDVNRLQQADRQQCRDHRRAAIAHERQRDAGNGHDPNSHSHVDKDLKHEHSRYTGRDERAEQVLGHHENTQGSPDQQPVEQQHEGCADEPVLLADGREDEVRMVLRHV